MGYALYSAGFDQTDNDGFVSPHLRDPSQALRSLGVGSDCPFVPAHRSFRVKGELLYTHDTLAWFFSSKKNARFGRFGANLSGGFSFGSISSRLGTYKGNLDILTSYYQRVAREVDRDPYLRTASLQYTGPTDLVLVAILAMDWEKMARGFDHREAHRRGTTTTLALERFYLAHNTYPDTLADLIPDDLAALPIDPWTGNPLIYRPHTTDPDNPTYLLYSVGPDATDDAGKPDPISNWGRQNPDIILSPPQPAPGDTPPTTPPD